MLTILIRNFEYCGKIFIETHAMLTFMCTTCKEQKSNFAGIVYEFFMIEIR